MDHLAPRCGWCGRGFFLIFYDPTTKKTLRQEKLAMHVHDFAITAAGIESPAPGHNRITVHVLQS